MRKIRIFDLGSVWLPIDVEPGVYQLANTSPVDTDGEMGYPKHYMEAVFWKEPGSAIFVLSTNDHIPNDLIRRVKEGD